MTVDEFQDWLRDCLLNHHKHGMYFAEDLHKCYHIPKDKYVIMSRENLAMFLADKVRQGKLIENIFPNENEEDIDQIRGVNAKVVDLLRKDKTMSYEQ